MARENTAAFDCISACKVLVAGDNEGCVWLYDVNSCVLEADKLKKMQTRDQTQVSCRMKQRIFFFLHVSNFIVNLFLCYTPLHHMILITVVLYSYFLIRMLPAHPILSFVAVLIMITVPLLS